MMVSLDFWFAIAYAAVSLAFIFRAQRFQWLWAAVLLWLGISALGARLLPGMWGFTHTGPLFIPHFYLTIASIFFFIDDCSNGRQKVLVGGRICRFNLICRFQCRHDFWLLFSWQAWFISSCHWQVQFLHGRPC